MKISFLILVVCAFFFYGCPGECTSDGYDEVQIVSTVELDSVISNISPYETCSETPFCYQLKTEENKKDSIEVEVFSLNDSLRYLIEHINLNDIYIVIDTIPIVSCKKSHWLAERGDGHYRVETKRLYSCVFFYEPTCQ